eukprot:NODE_1982_length_1234_cov_7.507173_g1645_i0.p9 GENE.NODE_1982_length_1234_cov_7.507173_g1645_i0~~NODE_1982_length_1234_cov_7.507173_g1645_i0.p9  ORF type:complete len:58 (+),score=0.25 NODE_1982_length_1234_cov_7.507173_g1645_i0:1048-1221(+)
MRQLSCLQLGRAGPLGLREVRTSSFAAAGPGRSGLRPGMLAHAHVAPCWPARGPLGR